MNIHTLMNMKSLTIGSAVLIMLRLNCFTEYIARIMMILTALMVSEEWLIICFGQHRSMISTCEDCVLTM